MSNVTLLATRLAGTEQELDRLNAEVAALRMLVTALMAKWAEEDPDPQASAFRMFEGMIASMHSTQSQYADHEPMLRTFGLIEDNLRFTLKNVQTRLGADR